MIFEAEELARAAGGRLVRGGPPGRVLTDTRALGPGDWFLALRGERFDAHDFLETAAGAGCAGVIVERLPADWERGAVVVPDTLVALQDIARRARARVRVPVVGITGSAGKTTTRALAAAALASLGPVHQTRGNLNNHIGLPLSLLDAPDDAAALVLEMGMSGPGEIALLQEIAAPDVRLITLVSAAHLEGVGSLEGVAACKQELFDGARPGDTALVNADDPRVAAMPLPAGVRVLRYGSSRGCDVRLRRVEVDPVTLSTLAVIGTDVGELEARVSAPGRHLALAACAAAAVGRALGVSPGDIAAGIAGYRPVGMRMRVERRAGGITVLNDAYNANPASTAAALETLAGLVGGRKIALLGDMLELGAAEASAHAEAAALAGRLGVDLLGLVGPRYAPHPAAGAGEVLRAPDADALRAALAGRLRPGDVVLLKGSRGVRMERVLQDLPVEEA